MKVFTNIRSFILINHELLFMRNENVTNANIWLLSATNQRQYKWCTQ